jgi:hypothetical protein
LSQVRRTTPATRAYEPISTVEDLTLHLQWALSVELSTIPPYRCALYSLKDRTTDAARLVRDVVIEEMLHMALVSNLMNAIGGQPSLAGDYVPLYPGFMPHHADGGPFIQLQPLSAELARVVFMAIEQPELDRHAPAQGDDFATIGQFYKAIELGFGHCADAHPRLFERDTGFQRADTYVGGGGGELIVVHDLASAKRALEEITEQGEGAPFAHPPYRWRRSMQSRMPTGSRSTTGSRRRSGCRATRPRTGKCRADQQDRGLSVTGDPQANSFRHIGSQIDRGACAPNHANSRTARRGITIRRPCSSPSSAARAHSSGPIISADGVRRSALVAPATTANSVLTPPGQSAVTVMADGFSSQ